MCNCKIGVVCEECLERNTTWKKAQHGLLKQRIWDFSTELERRLTMAEQLHVGEQKIILDLQDQLSPSPCGVKGHCKVDWTERRAGERRGNAVPGIEDRRKYGSGGSWLERRITDSGGYCRRCKEINRACAEAELSEAERQGERIEKAVTEALEAAVVRVREAWDNPPVLWMALVNAIEAAIRGKEEKWRQ